MYCASQQIAVTIKHPKKNGRKSAIRTDKPERIEDSIDVGIGWGRYNVGGGGVIAKFKKFGESCFHIVDNMVDMGLLKTKKLPFGL